MRNKKDRFVHITSTTGYLSHGAIYGLMGIFAIAAAFTSTEEKDSKGVLRFIVDQPFGQILLSILTLGIFCYVVWRVTQAIVDPEDKGHDLRGWTYRLSYLGAGLTFLSIGFVAVKALLGEADSKSDKAESWSAMILSLPFGRWVLGAAFLVVLSVGLYQGHRGVTLSFAKKLDLQSYAPKVRRAIIWASAFGHIVRSILILLISAYLFQAAWFLDAEDAKGLGGALNTIHDQPFGRWLLALAGLGLIGCGVYAFARSSDGTEGMSSE